eukprot:TRINITY_DN6690_c0_g1_i1.p1 TRINITY_DN6690_c0_g1~~TRINITY_DN6690_c0_g1_i1.p1  ORF type:complete len:226 (-),score=47.10 TRINITY_DN6690_c0_g1_i1:40-717(-)
MESETTQNTNRPSDIVFEQRDDDDTAPDIHLLPFGFKNFSGPAKISTYFVTEERLRPDGTKFFRSTFRGREFFGENVDLASYGLQGFLTSEDLQHDEDNEDENTRKRTWNVEHNVDSLCYWNREREPSANDKIHRWLRWSSLSRNIHKKLTAEDIQKMKEEEEAEKNKTDALQSEKETPAEVKETTSETPSVEESEQHNEGVKRKRSSLGSEGTEASPSSKKKKT